MVARFEGIRTTTWRALVGSIVVYAAFVISSNLTAGGLIRALEEIEATTYFWIGPQLLLPLATLAAALVVMLGIGRLRMVDVGWSTTQAVQALVVTYAFWLGMQATLYLIGRGSHDSEWSLGWETNPFPGVFSQLLGNALLEETFFRGYLLPQLFILLARVSRPGLALFAGIVMSLGLFVLSHLPRLLSEAAPSGESTLDALSWTARFGAILTLIFLVTRNVFISVGLHALWNARPHFIEAPLPIIERVWWALSALLVVGWWLGRRVRVRDSAALRSPSA